MADSSLVKRIWRKLVLRGTPPKQAWKAATAETQRMRVATPESTAETRRMPAARNPRRRNPDEDDWSTSGPAPSAPALSPGFLEERRRANAEIERKRSIPSLVNDALAAWGKERRKDSFRGDLDRLLRDCVRKACYARYAEDKTEAVYAECKRLLALRGNPRRRRNPRTYLVHDRELGDFLDFDSLKVASRWARRRGLSPAESVYIEEDEVRIPLGRARPHLVRRIPSMNPKRRRRSRWRR